MDKIMSERTRLSLADSLAADHECSAWVIQRIRVIEGQYDELFNLAEGLDFDIQQDIAHDELAQFLLAQKRRFSDTRDSKYQLGTLGRIYEVLEEPIDDNDYIHPGG